MTNSILIGKLIYDTIMDDDTLREAIHYTKFDEKQQKDIDKYAVFPLIAGNDTPFPIIIYTRTSVNGDTATKDGVVGDKVGFQISVGSDTYFQSAELANEVRDLFEHCIISDETLTIKNINMSSITESFVEDTYIQTLNFECSAE